MSVSPSRKAVGNWLMAQESVEYSIGAFVCPTMRRVVSFLNDYKTILNSSNSFITKEMSVFFKNYFIKK